jgi:hypothetical protein
MENSRIPKNIFEYHMAKGKNLEMAMDFVEKPILTVIVTD